MSTRNVFVALLLLGACGDAPALPKEADVKNPTPTAFANDTELEQDIAYLDGRDGKDGAAGPQGPQGLQGDAGLTGSAGSQGVQGEIGPVGSMGAQGLRGYGAYWVDAENKKLPIVTLDKPHYVSPEGYLYEVDPLTGSLTVPYSGGRFVYTSNNCTGDGWYVGPTHVLAPSFVFKRTNLTGRGHYVLKTTALAVIDDSVTTYSTVESQGCTSYPEGFLGLQGALAFPLTDLTPVLAPEDVTVLGVAPFHLEIELPQ